MPIGLFYVIWQDIGRETDRLRRGWFSLKEENRNKTEISGLESEMTSHFWTLQLVEDS